MTEAAQALDWLAAQPELRGAAPKGEEEGEPWAPLAGASWAAYTLVRWGRAPAARRFHQGVTRAVALRVRRGAPLLGEVGRDPDEQSLAAWGTWLWSLSQYLIQSRAPVMPKGAVRPAVAVARELMAVLTAARGDTPRNLTTPTLVRLYAGLIALDRWVKVPGLVPVIGDLWEAVKEPAKAAGCVQIRPGRAPATPAEAASLLATAVPFDLLGDHDPLVRATLRQVEELGGIEAVDDGEALGILGWFYARGRKPGETVRCLERLEPRVAGILGADGPQEMRPWDKRLTEVALHLVLLKEWQVLSAFIERWLKGEK